MTMTTTPPNPTPPIGWTFGRALAGIGALVLAAAGAVLLAGAMLIAFVVGALALTVLWLWLLWRGRRGAPVRFTWHQGYRRAQERPGPGRRAAAGDVIDAEVVEVIEPAAPLPGTGSAGDRSRGSDRG